MSTDVETPVTAAAPATLQPCAHRAGNGQPCVFKARPGKAHCFWHDATQKKSHPQVGLLLARLVAERTNCEGFELAGINLEHLRLQGARLVHANLEGAHLFNAHLENAHLFAANLKKANLFKAYLTGANLRSADLTDANLLGAQMRDTKMEGVNLGRRSVIFNERRGNEFAHMGKRDEARRFWQEAEEIYLALHNNFNEAGRSDAAGDMYYRFMVVRRKLLPRATFRHSVSWFMDMLCGYGEKPRRIVSACLLLIFVSSIFYFAYGIDTTRDYEVTLPNGSMVNLKQPVRLGLDLRKSAIQNFTDYTSCIYFSVVTMTTTGYGDMTPSEASRPFAALEAFSGTFLIAVFVMVFGRKMMRA